MKGGHYGYDFIHWAAFRPPCSSYRMGWAGRDTRHRSACGLSRAQRAIFRHNPLRQAATPGGLIRPTYSPLALEGRCPVQARNMYPAERDFCSFPWAPACRSMRSPARRWRTGHYQMGYHQRRNAQRLQRHRGLPAACPAGAAKLPALLGAIGRGFTRYGRCKPE